MRGGLRRTAVLSGWFLVLGLVLVLVLVLGSVGGGQRRSVLVSVSVLGSALV
jgi:hypothetical protein